MLPMKPDNGSIYLDIFDDWKTSNLTVPVIIRCDDFITSKDKSFMNVFDICERERVFSDVAVIPLPFKKNRKKTVSDVSSYKFLRFHQHGYKHANAEKNQQPIEFTTNMPIKELKATLFDGREILLDSLGDKFDPIYTPPWNRYGKNTINALDSLGFKILSAAKYCDYKMPTAVKFIGTNADAIIAYRPLLHASFDQIMKRIISAFEMHGYVSILVHPNKMQKAQIALFNKVIKFLKNAGIFHFTTMSAYAKGLRQ